MKRYLKNLWLALAGRDPYREEVAEVRGQLERTAEDVRSLRDMYCAAVQKWDDAVKRTKDFEQLTENLRQRIVDKDTLMEGMKKGYQERIDHYTREIERLRNEIKTLKVKG